MELELIGKNAHYLTGLVYQALLLPACFVNGF